MGDPVTIVADALKADADRVLAYGDEAVEFNKGKKNPKTKKPDLNDQIKALIDKEPALSALQGVEFKPMADLKKSKKPAVRLIPSPRLGLGAWTMSGTLVYVNLDWIKKVADSHKRTLDDQLIDTLKHEALHVVQFRKGGRPKSHLDMLKFECAAYSDGSNPAGVCAAVKSIEDRLAATDPAVKISDQQANDEARKWMVDRDYLPKHDKVDDLYEP